MKKKLLFFCTILLCFPLFAQKSNEIKASSNIDEVTVFIKGAQVHRTKTLDLPAGKSTIRFTKLSPYIDAKSVQVKVNGEIMVLSVNYQMKQDEESKEQLEKTKKLEAQLKDITLQIELEEVKKEVVAEELSFLKENKKIGGTTQGINYTNLQQTASFYSERISTLKNTEIAIWQATRKLKEQKSEIEKELNEIKKVKQEVHGEIVVNIDNKSPLSAVKWEVSYFVNNASWYPVYDLKAKSILDNIQLVYKANIQQNTKEDWKDVKLKISSAEPTNNNVRPILQPYYLNYYSVPPRYNVSENANQIKGKIVDASTHEPLIGATVKLEGSTIGTVADFDGNYSLTLPQPGGRLTVSYIGYIPQTLSITGNPLNVYMQEDTRTLDEVVIVAHGIQKKSNVVGSVATIGNSPKQKATPAPIPVPVAQVENKTSIEFEIKTPYTIPSGNENTVVEMENYSLPVEFEYYSVPKINKQAFLQAKIADWEQYNLLEGETNIFFENTYVGKTILDVRFVTDTLDVSLGTDKNVLVQRERIENYKARKGIGSKNEETRAWKITVKNNKKQPLSFTLLDQIPVSTLEEIEVTTEELSQGKLDSKTGEIKWLLELQPGEKKEIELRYKIRYPKGKTLHIE